jgi:serine/threonine protein kinase
MGHAGFIVWRLIRQYVWSAQAEFLIAAKGRPPFKQPQSMSPELRDFIERCTVFDPEIRPSAADLLHVRHPPAHTSILSSSGIGGHSTHAHSPPHTCNTRTLRLCVPERAQHPFLQRACEAAELVPFIERSVQETAKTLLPPPTYA